ncbi:MAG: glycosyltransferase family 39 protein [Planctomycetaceae bacterium]
MRNKTNENTCSLAGAPPFTRVELAVVGIVVLAGVVLRGSLLSRAAVEHFDEGVYASNFWFAGTGSVYPFQHLYAPPLLPTLVEWSIKLLGSGHLGTLSVNLLFGSATIVLAWWVGRSMFGPPAGAATATLAASNDFHILYSRTVLTDPLLCFWMLAAVYLAWEALRRRCFGWAMMAGVATAAAWWTKYNGWLPLAIGLAGMVPWLIFQKPANISSRKSLGVWVVIAATAFALWSPVLYGLADHGGYAAVQANHRGYVVGLDGWLESLKRHVAAQRHFEGWLSAIGAGLALLAAVASRSHPEISTWNRQARRMIGWLPAALWLVALAALLGSGVMLELLAIVGLILLIWAASNERPSQGLESNRALAYWMTAAWLIGLLVLTPLYRAYPRLVLPSLVATWLAAGATLGRFLDAWISRRAAAAKVGSPPPMGSVLRHFVVSAAVVIGMVIFTGRLNSRGIPGWEDRTGLESIAARIVDNSPDSTTQTGAARSRRLYFVFGEPALVFHILANGQTAVPIADLGGLRSSPLPPGTFAYLVAGPHAERTPAFVAELAQSANRFEVLATYDYLPSDLVLLDEYSADRVEQTDFDRAQAIRLYRVK